MLLSLSLTTIGTSRSSGRCHHRSLFHCFSSLFLIHPFYPFLSVPLPSSSLIFFFSFFLLHCRILPRLASPSSSITTLATFLISLVFVLVISCYFSFWLVGYLSSIFLVSFFSMLFFVSSLPLSLFFLRLSSSPLFISFCFVSKWGGVTSVLPLYVLISGIYLGPFFFFFFFSIFIHCCSLIISFHQFSFMVS